MHKRTQRWWIFLSVIVFAYYAAIVFIPVVIALFSAMLLWPVVEWLDQHGCPRLLAGLGVTLGFVGSLGLAGWIVFSSAVDIGSELPVYSQKIQAVLEHLRETTTALELKSFSIFHASAGAAVQKVELIERIPSWSAFVIRSAGSVTEYVTIALFVPLLLLYLFLDKENLVESVDTVLGRYAYLPRIHRELPRMVRAFVNGNIVTGIFLVLTQAITLYALGFENWASLGVVSGMLNLLPILGTPLAVLFPLCQAVIQFPTLSPALLMMAAFVVLHFVANNIVLPLLVGVKINVNSATLVVGLLFWSWLWGVGGFLMAIPMTALLKIFLECHPDTLPIANLMSARPIRLTTKHPPA